MNSSRSEERKDDYPPYSRVFVVCSRDMTESNLRDHFKEFGELEDIYLVKDRSTGESRGVAYVKYTTTSAAAAAIDKLHLATLPGFSKPLKVMIALNKNTNSKNEITPDQCSRLFIRVSKQATELEIRKYFSELAKVESVYIQKDKSTNESKGLAYVNCKSFLDAAKAFEKCDRKYKPVFATPKQDLKRGRDNELANIDVRVTNSHHRLSSQTLNPVWDDLPSREIMAPRRSNPQDFTQVCAVCTPIVPERYIESLFNIIPGMIKCEYTVHTKGGYCKSIITYIDEKGAACAVERINNFEFPTGEIIHVNPELHLSKAANDLSCIVNDFKQALDTDSPALVQLADAIAQASSLIKAATEGKKNMVEKPELEYDRYLCSVPLPPSQPLAASTAKVAQRCFIVCKPNPPHVKVLKNVFGRFGDLIDVSIIPNKTFGFVKYASTRSAQNAIKTLNKQTVCGIQLKVIEAEDKPSKSGERQADDDSDDIDRKRMKLIEY